MKIRAMVSLLAAVALLGAALLLYTNDVRRSVREKTYDTLTETAAQHADLIAAQLDGQYYVLESLAAYIDEKNPERDRQDIVAAMRDMTSVGDFSTLFCADEAGQAFDEDGRTTDVGETNYFRRSMRGERAIEKTRSSDPYISSGFVLSVPITHDGSVSGVLCGLSGEKQFAGLLQGRAYDGTAFAFLCEASGDILTRSDDEYFLHQSDNMFDLYAEASLEGETLEEVRRNMAEGASGAFCARFKNAALCVAYSPFGINDWMIVCAVPEDVADKADEAIRQSGVHLIVHLVIIGLASVFYVTWVDRRRLRRVEEDKERYRIVGEFSDAVLFEADLRADRIAFHQKYVAVFGTKPAADRFSMFLLRNPDVAQEDDQAMRLFYEDILTGQERAQEFRMRVADGGYRWIRMEYRALSEDSGRLIGRLLNVDAQRREIDLLREKAQSDSLTRLLNRASFREQAQTCIERGGTHAMFIIDIDDFKGVNDACGHAEGDKALTDIAALMQSVFRATDLLGRLGGDEFCVLMADIHAESIASVKAQRILDAAASIRLGEKGKRISCSVGIAFSPDDAKDIDALYRVADAALYHAKGLGKGQFSVYNAMRKDSA